jgi:hypothetical protein
VAGHGVDLLCCRSFSIAEAVHAMIETNPIAARINDLKGRVQSLRGYL